MTPIVIEREVSKVLNTHFVKVGSVAETIVESRFIKLEEHTKVHLEEPSREKKMKKNERRDEERERGAHLTGRNVGQAVKCTHGQVLVWLLHRCCIVDFRFV